MEATTTAAKAVAAGAGTDTDAAPSSPPAPASKAAPVQQEPLPGDAAAAAVPVSATATTSPIVENDGEDEQVEKFYALLANIRAMRRMYRSGSAGAGASTDSAGEVSGGGRKRVRGVEPSWRPAFRMEDFEEAPGSASKKERRVDSGSRRPGKETTEGEGDDVEKKGRRVVTPSSQRNV